MKFVKFANASGNGSWMVNAELVKYLTDMSTNEPSTRLFFDHENFVNVRGNAEQVIAMLTSSSPSEAAESD